MNAELQRAQDMLDVMRQQRDQAMNAQVLSHVEVLAARREIAELQDQVRQLTAQLTATAPVAPSQE